jgi:hypothetical protein
MYIIAQDESFKFKYSLRYGITCAMYIHVPMSGLLFYSNAEEIFSWISLW